MDQPRASEGLLLALFAACAVGLVQLLVEVLSVPTTPAGAGWAIAGVLVLHALIGALTFGLGWWIVRGRFDPRPVALVSVTYVAILQVALSVPWGSVGAVLVRAGGVLLAVVVAVLALQRRGGSFAWLQRRRLWLALDVVLAALVLGAAHRWSKPAPEPVADAARPSLLLVSIDTLRADYVGVYGREVARTPVLDALAAEGVRFEHAICQSIITGPSHASMLSGLAPTTHGILHNLVPLPGEVETLAEVFARAGFDTGAFIGGYPLKQESLGVLSRFGSYDERFHAAELLPPAFFRTSAVHVIDEALRVAGVDLHPHHRPADQVTDAASAWLASGAGPFFGFVHYFDPHLPFEAPREFQSEAAREWTGPGRGHWHGTSVEERVEIIQTPGANEHMQELYDAEVAFVDRQLGRLVEAARARAGEAGLWILVTADHGQSHGERASYFERTLYDETLHVPMILVPPAGPLSQPGRVIGGQARIIDVAPTLLDAAGLAGELETDGTSLLPSLVPGAEPPMGTSVTAALSLSRAALAVRTPAWKAIWREGYWDRNAYAWDPEERELYDLAADPDEASDRAQELPERWEELAAELDLLRVADTSAVEGVLEPRQLRALRALGYVH